MAKEPNFNPELGSPEAYLALMQSRVQRAQENLNDVITRKLGSQAEQAARMHLEEQQANLENFIEQHPEIKELVTTETEGVETI